MSEFEVGGYGVSSWGYDQTNVDFYKVVRKSAKSVWLMPVQSAVQETGFMCGNSVPSDEPVEWKGKVLMKRLSVYENENGRDEYCGGYFSSELVRPWNGKPERSSWYA